MQTFSVINYKVIDLEIQIKFKSFQWTETGVNGQAGPHVLLLVVSVHTPEGEHALIQPHRTKGNHVLGTEHKLILVLKDHVQVYRLAQKGSTGLDFHR